MKRYTADRNIVDIIDKHGNYLDDLLGWELDTGDGKTYLSSSYKIIDKIDLEDIVNGIFINKRFTHTAIDPETKSSASYIIEKVRFDIIKNRFAVLAQKQADQGQVESTDTELLSKRVEGDPNLIPEMNDQSEFYIDRHLFGSIFDSIASTPAGQPFVAEQGQLEQIDHLVELLKGGENGYGKGNRIQFGILSTDIGRKGKEISGPKKAAQALINLIRRLRIINPEINRIKAQINRLILQKYSHIFKGHKQSAEVSRHNFYMFQLDQMKKARFVRIDDTKAEVDLSRKNGFSLRKKDDPFSPILLTPNIQIELSTASESHEQLMDIPNNPEFSEQFYSRMESLFIAEGHPEDVIVYNLVLQLLLTGGYIQIEDLNRGKISGKVNRETLAAAKHAVIQWLKNKKDQEREGKIKSA